MNPQFPAAAGDQHRRRDDDAARERAGLLWGGAAFTLALHTIKSLRNSILSLYTDPFKQAARGHRYQERTPHFRPYNVDRAPLAGTS